MPSRKRPGTEINNARCIVKHQTKTTRRTQIATTRKTYGSGSQTCRSTWPRSLHTTTATRNGTLLMTHQLRPAEATRHSQLNRRSTRGLTAWRTLYQVTLRGTNQVDHTKLKCATGNYGIALTWKDNLMNPKLRFQRQLPPYSQQMNFNDWPIMVSWRTPTTS